MIRGARRTKGRKPTRRKAAFRRRVKPGIWVLRHVQVFLATLGRLSRRPFGTLMTTAVIGIAVALPAGLHLLVQNVQSLSGAWEGSSHISLYLELDTPPAAASQLADRLRGFAEIAEVWLITREQALEEFRALSGFGEALDLLQDNPLPAVITVLPDVAHSDPDLAQALSDRLAKEAGVELARLDLQWVRRLHAFTAAIQRGIFILAALLGAAVLLVIGNTIRLEIENRRTEIEIVKLVGGTNAFIRRPFLYTGMWFGLFGGLIAWMLIAGGLWLLQGPVGRLAGLYDRQFDLVVQQPIVPVGLLLGTPLLGLCGAWLAVSRQIARVKPE